MGQNLSQTIDNVLLQEMEDECFGNVTLYYNDQNPYTLQCKKSYTNSENKFHLTTENFNRVSFTNTQGTI